LKSEWRKSEVKKSLAPKLESGFHFAHADLSPVCLFVVYPGTERYRIFENVEAISLAGLALELLKENKQ